MTGTAGLTDAQDLLLVRLHMPPGQGHKFHRNPEMEDHLCPFGQPNSGSIASAALTAGQIAHIPKDVVHGTYNAGSETLHFLAILSPAKITGPALIDMSELEPWKSLRA
jgi:quercetin dioxygenase-like cupin family protein